MAQGIQGETATGYEKPDDLGPFECANCSHFSPESSSCGQKTMMLKSNEPRLANGRVKVEPEACCSYVDRMGRIQEDELEESEEVAG